MLDLDIFSRRLEELHLESAVDHGKAEVDLGFGQVDADALSGTFGERDQILLEADALSSVQPSFWDELEWLGKDSLILVHEN